MKVLVNYLLGGATKEAMNREEKRFPPPALADGPSSQGSEDLMEPKGI